MESNAVNHPRHYNEHPSGIECIDVVEHMNFNIGNAIKYLWRADGKGGLEDFKKAIWYINREIERREKKNASKAVTTVPITDVPVDADELVRKVS